MVQFDHFRPGFFFLCVVEKVAGTALTTPSSSWDSLEEGASRGANHSQGLRNVGG